MADLLTKLILYLMRNQLSKWHEGSIEEQRTRQEKSTRFFRLPKKIQSTIFSIDGIQAEWIETEGDQAGTILYLHGGAYALGSVDTHRELISRLVINTNCKTLAINYRRAPEYPFPAALEDTLKSYDWLLSSGISQSQICFGGDSAGGGLAIASLLALREKDVPLPAGVFCFSPWLDLTLSGGSMHTLRHLDPILSHTILTTYVDYYTNGYKATDPLISPLFAENLRNLPPILIQSGRNEVLLDDAIRFYEKAHQAGVDVTLKIWDDMFHVFQLIPFLQESKESMEEVSEFVARVLNRSG
ncbi:MAG TPA: alpha/beta hydrolase [Anaerolineaceae bacterium]|nr:alpha/beta hydrolase [Anaerolineaceae bacterium]